MRSRVRRYLKHVWIQFNHVDCAQKAFIKSLGAQVAHLKRRETLLMDEKLRENLAALDSCGWVIVWSCVVTKIRSVYPLYDISDSACQAQLYISDSAFIRCVCSASGALKVWLLTGHHLTLCVCTVYVVYSQSTFMSVNLGSGSGRGGLGGLMGPVMERSSSFMLRGPLIGSPGHGFSG